MRSGRPCVVGGLCRSLIPLAFDLDKSSDMMGARLVARASRAHPTSSWHWSRRTFPPNTADSDGKRVSGCSHVTRGHPAASAGLFPTAGEPASGMLIMSYIRVHASRSKQLACVWTAASGGTCARYHGNRCDLSEVAAPGWLPLAACGNAPGVSSISADPRATGRPWGTAVALSSHGHTVTV
jgi:hypothetical protein